MQLRICKAAACSQAQTTKRTVAPTCTTQAFTVLLPRSFKSPAGLPHTHTSQPLAISRRTRCQAGYGATETQVEELTTQLKTLEAERDEAIATAESCAKTCVKLTEMVERLEQLALERVKEGDEARAREFLKEKSALKEVLERNTSRAQSNFALAAKLAQKIGDKQNQILQLLPASSRATSAYSPGSSSSSSSWSGSSGSSTYTSSSSYSPPVKLRWQQSLEEAADRLRKQEAAALTEARIAKLSAEASIAAAQERIRQQTSESISSAQSRLRRGAEDSLAEARARLRAQDAEMLEYCRRVVARFRAGEYVSEEDLEFAFQQLERRLL